MKEAQAKGLGAVSLDGRMIDAASVRQAEVLVAKAKAIAQSEKPKAKSKTKKNPGRNSARK
jgi:citrate lyase beta subunit